MTKTIELPITDNYRIIAISDIHGHLDVFESLIDRLELKPDDHLFILGDIINKGPENLGTVRAVMNLSKRPNTYVLKGNHELFICHYLYGGHKGEDFLSYIKEDHFHTILHEVTDHDGFSLKDCPDMPTLSHWCMAHYRDEFNFLSTLPVLAFADDLIFVHGGYHKGVDVETEEGRLLKFDDFNRLSGVNDRTVIVGHWPTANLRTDQNSNKPFFNHEKNIISIDGGLGVKTSGELNALIIEKADGIRTIRYLQENRFERRTILKKVPFKEEEKIFVNYPHFDIEVIKRGPTMSLCRHVQSGKELSIFNSLLETVNQKPQVITTYINHFLNLEVGDEVELVMTYDDCALVKHNEEFGWLWKNQLYD